jgi:hypothetical protein
VRDLDDRVHFIYYVTGVTPGMAAKLIGLGSQYAAAATDSEDKPLDGISRLFRRLFLEYTDLGRLNVKSYPARRLETSRFFTVPVSGSIVAPRSCR